jgi:hypothetical protein
MIMTMIIIIIKTSLLYLCPFRFSVSLHFDQLRPPNYIAEYKLKLKLTYNNIKSEHISLGCLMKRLTAGTVKSTFYMMNVWTYNK